MLSYRNNYVIENYPETVEVNAELDFFELFELDFGNKNLLRNNINTCDVLSKPEKLISKILRTSDVYTLSSQMYAFKNT